MSNLKHLTYSALFTGIIAILAQVAIPLPFSPVPVTGQLIGVLLAGALLGSRNGLLSVTAYLLLGAAGAPVFSMARGGIYMLAGPTGGYLWGFLPAVLLVGLAVEKKESRTYLRIMVAMMGALALIYLFGGLQLGLILRYTPTQVLLTGIIPFLPFDLFKVFLAAIMYYKISTSLEKNGLGEIPLRR